ncbi:hypothetical protein STEG23_012105, partial [Scotinomys teguina]
SMKPFTQQSSTFSFPTAAAFDLINIIRCPGSSHLMLFNTFLRRKSQALLPLPLKSLLFIPNTHLMHILQMNTGMQFEKARHKLQDTVVCDTLAALFASSSQFAFGRESFTNPMDLRNWGPRQGCAYVKQYTFTQDFILSCTCTPWIHILGRNNVEIKAINPEVSSERSGARQREVTSSEGKGNGLEGKEKCDSSSYISEQSFLTAEVKHHSRLEGSHQDIPEMHGGARQWWYLPLIPALRRQRQMDLCEFEAILVYRMSPLGTLHTVDAWHHFDESDSTDALLKLSTRKPRSFE